jgi:hypothetical protein
MPAIVPLLPDSARNAHAQPSSRVGSVTGR